MLRKLKQEYEHQIREKDKLFKELQILRVKREEGDRHLHDELSRLSFEKKSLEKLAVDLRETNMSLQKEVERMSVQ